MEVSPSSTSTTRSLDEAFESKEVSGYLVVDLEFVEDGTFV